jgi:HAD superfamily hydrolase (TIGR01509 family)
MDGTLIDNMPFHNRVWIEYLTELGAQPDARTFHDLSAGKTNPEILRQFLGPQLTDADVAVYSQEKELRYRRLYHQVMQPIPGLAGFLESARQLGLPMALATSAGRENIDFVLRRLALENTFQAVVSAEDVTRGKPDPQAFMLAAQRLGIEPARCLVLEDSVKGIQAAHRAGMKVVAVLTGMRADEAMALHGVIAAVQDYNAFLSAYTFDQG